MAGVTATKLEVGAWLGVTGVAMTKEETGAWLGVKGVMASKLEVGAWIAPGGVTMSKEEVGAWIKLIEGVSADKLECGAWIMPAPGTKTLAYPASQSSHSVEPTTSGARELRPIAGPAKTRATHVSVGDVVGVAWVLRGEKLKSLLAFLRVNAIRGEFFKMDLVRDGFVEQELVKLIPGSVRVGERRGDGHTVTAQVHVAPKARSTDEVAVDEAIVGIFETYGDGVWDGLHDLEQLANFELPDIAT